MPISNPVAGHKIVTGSYVGNITADRQIVTGCKCSLVIIQASTAKRCTMIPSLSIVDTVAANNVDITAEAFIHATDGFEVDSPASGFNDNGLTYYYLAVEV